MISPSPQFPAAPEQHQRMESVIGVLLDSDIIHIRGGFAGNLVANTPTVTPEAAK